MVGASLEHFFDFKRLPTDWHLILLLLYAPIGLCLAVVRFFIGLHVYAIACALPKTSVLRRLILRPMCTVLGVVVVQENCENFDEQCRVLVSNYTTKFDYVPLQLVVPHHVISIWNFSDLVMRLLGYLDLGAQYGRETLISNAKQLTEGSNIPLLSFPEGTTTNGRAGLLKFSVWPFSLERPVQPVVIKIYRPLFPIAHSLAESQLGVDWFWLLFVPVTIFHISYLPVQSIADDEEALEFAQRVQKIMANKLGIRATNYNCADKLDLIKRISHDENLTDNNSRSRSQNSSQQMLEQVKNVLPHVPDSVIVRDLAMTKDADLTVSNILEGRTGFVRADQRQKTTSSTTVSSLAQNSSRSSTFGKSIQETQASFHDRKKAMIEDARRRYLEKFAPAE